MRFSAKIAGAEIRCEIEADTALAAPTLCFSLMAPVRVVSGGTLTRALGGYAEIALPDLAPGAAHALVVAYENPGFCPVNRAWLPLGAYLRHAGGVTPLPPLEAGVRPGAPPPPEPIAGLGLCPPPGAWAPAPGALDLSRGLATDHEAFAAVAQIAATSRLTDAPFLAHGLTHGGAPVALKTDPTLAPEAYALTIAPGGVTVSAAGRPGLFYAAITLRNLQITHGAQLPFGQLDDAPS